MYPTLQPMQSEGQSREVPLMDYDSPQVQEVHARVLTRKVVMLAAGTMVFFALQFLINFVLVTAEFNEGYHEVMHIFKKHGHEHRWGNHFADMLLALIPSMLTGMCCVMLIPLCGYCGAKNGNKTMMGMFCCCNGLMSICSCLGVLVLVIYMVGISIAAPEIEEMFKHCDPTECMRQPDRLHMIDCFAPSVLGREYTVRFPDIHHISPRCPLGHAMMQCRDLAEEQVFDACKIDDKAVKVIQHGQELVPVIVPKLMLILTLKLLSAIPAMFLSCLGFVWGKRLHSHLGQNYQLQPPPVATQQMMPQYNIPISTQQNVHAPPYVTGQPVAPVSGAAHLAQWATRAVPVGGAVEMRPVMHEPHQLPASQLQANAAEAHRLNHGRGEGSADA